MNLNKKNYNMHIVSRLPVKEYLVVILITTLTLSCSFLVNANETAPVVIKNYSDARLKTILLSRQGWDFSMPAIKFGTTDKLELRFDMLIDLEDSYYYSLELCEANWELSTLSSFDYMEGFEENRMPEAMQSVNTTKAFRHFSLEIPNEDVQLIRSGNYIVRVYEEGDKEKPILIRRFMLYEDLASIVVKVDKMESELLEKEQSLKIEVNPGLGTTIYPGECLISVLQNYDWNSLQEFEDYSIAGSNTLMLNKPNEVVFNAGNEFRFFDIKSLKFISERVDYFEFTSGEWHVYLKPDKLRIYKGYFKNDDLNGHFYIKNQEGYDQHLRHLDADYVNVHFFLPVEEPFGTNVYIYGGLADWSFTDNNMVYRPELGFYEGVLKLKQGLYNYQYVLKDYNSSELDISITEDNHSETENFYMAMMYYYDTAISSWRLLGVSMLNSEAKQ